MIFLFTYNTKYIFSASDDFTVKIWDFETKEEKGCLKGHTARVNNALITRDNKFIISYSDDKTAIL
jgi:WD domain, G-beta repeat.